MERLSDDRSGNWNLYVTGCLLRVKICCLAHYTIKIDPLPLPPLHRKYVFTHKFNDNDDKVECDAVPDAGASMWTTRVLSIIVKNMQSYIVAIV